MTATAKPRLQDLPGVALPDVGQALLYLGDGEWAGGDVVTSAGLDAIQDEIDALETTVAAKQDASTAATDAELASAVSAQNSALAAHAADTTFQHGIANFNDLALTSDSRFPTSGQKAALAGTSGTPSGSNLYATKATTDALTAVDATKQPLDSDLTAIAALTTTSYGRSLLELANQAALLSAAGAAASSHTHAQADITSLVSDLSGKQPLDSDLTSIAALTTTSYGRGLLELANQAALLSAAGAAAASHTHAESDITNLVSDLAAKQATSAKGQANGYASLDSGGKVPSGQIPALSLVTVQTAASEAAQLALTTQEGDVVVRTDEAKTYMRNAGTSGTMTDFTFLQTPASAVLSVNGQTGVVSLDATDVGAATSADIATHSADTTSVHGITDTSVLATDSEVATAVSDHSADTTSVHGISDTSVLATDSEVATAVSDHSADTTSVHGIADTSVLATDSEVATAVSDHSADTTSVHGIADTSVLATATDIAGRQPLDSDLTAIAALTTTSFGRSLLALADAAALLSAAGAQASDSDLTAIAALTTTSFGRSLLTLADAAALLSAAGAAAASHTHTASQVTDFDTQVRTNRLDQMTAPNTTLSMGTQKISNVVNPTAGSQEVATADYVDDADAGVTSFLSGLISAKTSASIMDTKGDLFAATAADTVDNLPAGTNNHVLMADSAQSFGLKYAQITDSNVASANKDGAAGTASMRTIGITAASAAAGSKYFPVLTQTGAIAASQGAAVHWFDSAGVRTTSGTGTAAARPFLVFNATDWPEFTVMNLQVSITTTATQTGVTFNFGFRPVAFTGTTTTIPTLAAAVSGSSVVFSAPATASETRGNSGDFNVPATDSYMIGCVTDATTAASSLTQFTAILRMR